MTTMTSSAVNALTNTWLARFPELGSRIHKAVEILRRGDVLPSFSSNKYLVKSSDGKGLYNVVYKGGKFSCTCPDAAKENKCKHKIACAILLKFDALPVAGVVSYGLDAAV